MKENNVDEYIKRIYQESEISKDIFKEAFSKLDSNRRNNNILKYVACFSLLIAFIGTSIFIFLSSSNEKLIASNDKEDGKIEIELPKYADDLPTASIKVGLTGSVNDVSMYKFISPIGLTMVNENTPIIAVVTLNKKLYYTNYSEKLKVYMKTPMTVAEASLEKVFKGEVNDKKFKIMYYGGVISLADYVKACFPEEIIKGGYDKMTDEYKNTTYIEVIDSFTMSMPPIETGKSYLVFMSFNKNFDKYQIWDNLIYEYDLENNKIKNEETGEWIDYYFPN